MASFSTSNNVRAFKTSIRIEKVEQPKKDTKEKNDTKEIWAKAKSYAHEGLWYEYVLPMLLKGQDVDIRGMDIHAMNTAMSDIWDTKQYEVNGQISVVETFTHDDNLSDGYTGECPTKYDKETGARTPVILNALATIGSNDFRYFVMSGDEWKSPCVPNDCFFGTYPVKYKGEIQKGKFRCILKQKK
jgi:hypothetical protein